MLTDLLLTKLSFPATSQAISAGTTVPRPRLLQKFNSYPSARLTLVSAPAGFGKTTFLWQWLSQVDCPIAWLSIDPADNNIFSFWQYVTAALEAVQVIPSEWLPTLMHLVEQQETESFLTALINQITTFSQPLILVLDDYHFIENSTIHQELTFLLDHAPQQLHLAIATRADPPLPLARLRGRGQLVELRATDLRFTPEETQTFLNQVMQLQLSAPQLEILQTRTEGWIVGLQLASLSLQNCQNPAAFIDSFQGSQSYILDYLTQEVLHTQPEALQSFLLKTSILDRLCGSLCDALLDEDSSLSSGAEILEQLEQANLFIVSLDHQRRWYRYHHLFRDLLHHQLQRSEADLIQHYHRRAAEWYQQQDLPDEAFKHYLIIQDLEQAANVIEQQACSWMIDAQYTTLMNHLQMLPYSMVRCRPWLCIYFAWTLWFTSGNLKTIARYLDDAEAAFELRTVQEKVLSPLSNSHQDSHQDSHRSSLSWTAHPEANEAIEFRGCVATLRSLLAHQQGVSEAIDQAHTVLNEIPVYNYWLRSMLLAHLGFSYYLLDQEELADRFLAEAVEVSFQCDLVDGVTPKFAGRVSESAVSCLIFRSHLQAIHGQLEFAQTLCESAVKLTIDRHWQGIPPGLTACLTLGIFQWWQNDSDRAVQTITTALEHGLHLKQSSFLGVGYSYLALVLQMQGKSDEAQAAIQRAEIAEQERRIQFDFQFPTFITVDLTRAKLWLLTGNLIKAMAWAKTVNLPPLSYASELTYLTLAQVWVLQAMSHPAQPQAWETATNLLSKLRQQTESNRRIIHLVDVLVLQAIVEQIREDTTAGLNHLVQALSLADPECYTLPFLDKNPSLSQRLILLLEQAKSQGIHSKFV
ncbi:MAG: hypothetical protein ACFBSC_07730 [Microcoleaceae cyanobacterium]